MNAEKTTEQLKKAVDLGLSFVLQGVGSNHALNIIKFVNKHNKRNPGKEIVFLNHSAVTTAFTNELCSFWHFGSTPMSTRRWRPCDPDDPRPLDQEVYLAHPELCLRQVVPGRGKQASRGACAQCRDRRGRADRAVRQVQDFTPFVAKIKASGADTILTGNWGPDMHRFVKGAMGRRPRRQVLYHLRRHHELYRRLWRGRQEGQPEAGDRDAREP